jgi:type IV pilus assembly protein PilC
MEAASKEKLIAKLHNMGYMTTRVTEAPPEIQIESFFDKIKPISAEDMIMFYVQFSNMLTAGIPILNALKSLQRQIENKRLKESVGRVARSVEAGEDLSGAFIKECRIFPKLFCNMVKAGEASGKLEVVLSRYAEYFEHQTDLQQKIKGALFYPMLLLVAGIGVTLFIVIFVIPQFAEIFTKTGIALPAPTVILFKVGEAIKHFWYLGILGAIVLWVAIKYYIGTKKGRLHFDILKLKLPVLGPLHRRTAIAGFTRTLATLVNSGVPLLESLDITKEVVGNEVLGRVIGNVRISVEKGESLSEPLKVSEEFPPDTVQMISVGEESGNLDDMLNKIADFYDMSIGYTLKKLIAIIEPLFLVIMGSMVGFIMASMLLPIFDMMKILKH